MALWCLVLILKPERRAGITSSPFLPNLQINMATSSRVFAIGTLLGFAFALGRRLGNKPSELKPIEFKIRGRDMVAICRTEDYRSQRTN
jgi:hypothetical protein